MIIRPLRIIIGNSRTCARNMRSPNSRIFLEFQVGNRKLGCVVVELFNNVVPKTAANFLGLCCGDKGVGRISNLPLTYAGTKVVKVLPGQYIQCGDIQYNNGQGGESIYGGTFADENFTNTHSCAGLITMHNEGIDSNASQFYVTLKAMPILNQRHVVVGQVRKGMEIIRAIERVPINTNDIPRVPVFISGCGAYSHDLIEAEIPSETIEEEIEADMTGENVAGEEDQDAVKTAAERGQRLLQKLVDCTAESPLELYDADSIDFISQSKPSQARTSFRARCQEFQTKQEVESARAAERSQLKADERSRISAADHSIWNEQSVFSRYERQLRRLQSTNDVAKVLTTSNRRRRPAQVPQPVFGDVTFINQRNRLFNRRLQRAYGSQVVEIEKNLERGTAL